MKTENLKLGQVVRSVAGRDKGRFLVVTEMKETDFVQVSDGDLRRLEKSKTKKIKHLAKTNYVIPELNERLEKGLKVSNADIRKYLDIYKKDYLIGEREVIE